MTKAETEVKEFELGHPIAARLKQLTEFVDENDKMGILDRRYLKQWLTDLQKMRVTTLKGKVQRTKRKATWALTMSINERKDFEGSGPSFEEALISMIEGFEQYVVQQASN